jgi:hypothetical protein
VLRPAPAAGPFARDFEAYYAAGAVWDRGGDPWSRDIWTVERSVPGVDPRRDELLPFVGPAAALPLFGALAHLPWPAAVRWWTALLAFALLLLVLAALALAHGRGARVVCGALLLGAAAAPATSDLSLGQAALLSAAGIALALWALDRRATVTAAFATLLAGIQPNLALALVSRLRDRTAIVATSVAFVVFAAITLAAGGGPHGLNEYGGILGEHGRAERFDVIQFTPAAIAWSFGARAVAATAIGTLAALAAIVAVVATTVIAKLNPRDGTLLALAALPFAVPFFHEHDFVVELIPLITLAIVARDGARLWAGIAAGLLLVDWLTLAQRGPAQSEVVLQGLAAACAFAALGAGTRLRRVDLAAPLTVLLLAVLAVPLARAYPAPVWPDTLPSSYHAAHSADASTVWAGEQRAAGLLTQVPAWGLLRAIPLAGCVVLAVAVVRSRRSESRYPRRRGSRTA